MNIQKKYGIKAKKSLGQNFLRDEDILKNIVAANAIAGAEIVEVGPGYGALSEKIVKQKPKKFEMIELDSFLVEVLQKRIIEEDWKEYCTDISVTEMDILLYKRNEMSPYLVIANIPYYITSPILHHFLYRVTTIPQSMTLLMQKDVADKISKQYHHKKPKSSVLSLFIAKKMDVKKVCDVGAQCFDPAPNVDSSVLYFTKKNDTDNDRVEDEIFLSFIKKAFCEPRKKLMSNLSKNGYDKEILEKIFKQHNIISTVRAEDLQLHDFLDVLGSLSHS